MTISVYDGNLNFLSQTQVRFVEELLVPSPERSSRLLLEPVPRRYHGYKWSDFYVDLNARFGVVVLGLYRCRTPCDAPLPYVLTCPPPDTVLYSADDDEDMVSISQNFRAITDSSLPCALHS